jgi:hypothetical protein
MVTLPLAGRRQVERHHARIFASTGGGKRQIVMDAQIGAKPDQMDGHKTPEMLSVAQTSRYSLIVQALPGMIIPR